MIERTLYTVPDSPKEAREEFLREARRRKVDFISETGEYFLAKADSPNLEWATDIAWKAFEFEVSSITSGAKGLRELAQASGLKSPRWIRLEGLHHRRASLIAELLPSAKAPELSYRRGAAPLAVEPARAGFFLTEPGRGVAVFDSLSPYPGGLVPFTEEKLGPPSRAYLKIWEIFSRLEHAKTRPPVAGESAVDLGSCPGGWTWALAERGVATLSIDGAPLDSAVEKRPEVTYQRGDAFRISPRKVDWVFSDMICEPKRLPELIRGWEAAGCTRFALSVKFKGEADEGPLAELRAIPGSGLRHLRQNKHELTWIKVPGLDRI